jgi:hypothetical protein
MRIKYDAAAWAAFYTQDAIDVWSYFSEGAAVGRPAILKRYESEFASYPPSSHSRLFRYMRSATKYARSSNTCIITFTGRAVL